jgi:predicted transcriptional regulator
MTYKTGTIGEFMQWTKRVVTDQKAVGEAPKLWFDSDKTAEKVLGISTSPEAMVKLLSTENLRLLHVIRTKRPESVRALAGLVRRKESNLSRTLKKLQEAGIVSFEQGPGRMRTPRLSARRVTLELDLVGTGSAVSLERPGVAAGAKMHRLAGAKRHQ